VRLSTLLALVLGLATISTAQDQANSAALEKLRALAGDWEGSFEWSGSHGGSGTMNASYYSTGNGSAVVENLIVDGVPSMTSVYHLDGADLRMTHYCAAENQPRLKASRIDLAQGIVDFTFVDVTNLRSADAGHVVGLDLRFVAPGHITLTYRFEAAGKSSSERIDLNRAASKSAGSAVSPK
jgi:hypothetical protein